MAYITTIERLGIEKGIEQGIKVGRKEGLKKAALVLMKNGFSDSIIVTEIGLSLDELNELKEQEKVFA